MKHILIADDQPHVSRVLKYSLEQAGYEVVTVTNGAQALESIRKDSPAVLITDIAMPKLTGRELCAAIKNEFPDRDFLIVVMTSRTAHEERVWTEKMENLVFMEKPLSPKKLVGQVNNYFSG